MSKHLSDKDLASIVDLITRMRGKITWDRIKEKVGTDLGFPHAKQSLMAYPEIKSAYHAKKSQRKDSADQRKQTDPKLPKDVHEYIAKLEKQNAELKELVLTMTKNANDQGVSIEWMETPFTPPWRG
ncbi:MAG: hypothetical protein P8P66_09545 [Paracoccaceae bacterium]|nr:hypothetical protein [Paracoccaceae bacterium]